MATLDTHGAHRRTAPTMRSRLARRWHSFAISAEELQLERPLLVYVAIVGPVLVAVLWTLMGSPVPALMVSAAIVYLGVRNARVERRRLHAKVRIERHRAALAKSE